MLYAYLYDDEKGFPRDCPQRCAFPATYPRKIMCALCSPEYFPESAYSEYGKPKASKKSLIRAPPAHSAEFERGDRFLKSSRFVYISFLGFNWLLKGIPGGPILRYSHVPDWSFFIAVIDLTFWAIFPFIQAFCKWQLKSAFLIDFGCCKRIGSDHLLGSAPAAIGNGWRLTGHSLFGNSDL